MPLLLLLQAATTAQAAIERIHDLTSLDTAATALAYYGRLLMEQPPTVHARLQAMAADLSRPVPTLRHLHERFLAEWERLYVAAHRTAA